jgi:hypothetical protein
MDVGDIIADRFELAARVGEGATTDVFRARDRAKGGKVAVKIVRTQREPDLRFAREVRILCQRLEASVRPAGSRVPKKSNRAARPPKKKKFGFGLPMFS